jgi:hypothetical protein
MLYGTWHDQLEITQSELRTRPVLAIFVAIALTSPVAKRKNDTDDVL